MILRSKKWAAVAAVLLFGCPRTVNLAPVIQVPPRLPFEVAAEVRRALAVANAGEVDAPEWRILGAHEAAGWVVEHYRLGRGLHLLISIDATSPAFTHQVWFDTRRLDPPASDALLDRLRDEPATEAMRTLELAGGRSSAGVARELGFFAVTMPRRIGDVHALATAVTHQAKRLAAARRTGTETATASLRSPARQVEARMVEALDQALRAGPGDAPSLEAVLAPERLVVVVTGNVDRTELLELLRRHHAGDGSPSGRTAEIPKLRSTAPAFPIDVEVPLDEGQALLLGWPAAPSDHDAALALEATAHILAGSDDSRLPKKLEARAAGIRARAPEGARTFEVTLMLAPSASATVATAMVREELEAIADGDTTGRELERARATLLGGTLQAASGLESRAELFASALLLGGGLDAVDLRIAAVEELEEPAVRKATRRLLLGAPAQILGSAGQGGP